ncbi:GNAT family N-acetyltransferase [Cereibacter sphaeroides]|uniref:GNAT family N-acetyltransferase n=1 Tax=Cereibacter sphaeroides TaxID=1063 RepID=UPI001F20FF8E|nr:GNAT family N-acetyltransferase [Cereibacter sphaeroides]MCE6958771.1 GNAT family N-acetyltransferase [Cereibacter sphaeroides]MCE6973355.1 GNAT family N-acetyltransferase [Cereibacter sphaeroides]
MPDLIPHGTVPDLRALRKRLAGCPPFHIGVGASANEILAFFLALAPADLFARFMSHPSRCFLETYAERSANKSLIVTARADDGSVAGMLELVPEGASGEVALAVLPPWRGHRLGDRMLFLARCRARHLGIHDLVFHTSATNRPMTALALRWGGTCEILGPELELHLAA